MVAAALAAGWRPQVVFLREDVADELGERLSLVPADPAEGGPSQGPGAAAGPPARRWDSTSARVMRPPTPVPVIAAGSTPASSTSLRTTGDSSIPAVALGAAAAGAGIAPDAGDRAEREGHFGLLNMQQRAEGIGAILDVRRWPGGGTHVQLEWRAR